MNFIDNIYKRSSEAKKKIILPEGEESRILNAVAEILEKDICIPVLIGDVDSVRRSLREVGVSENSVEIIDNKNPKNLEKYVALYCEVRKHKLIKEDESRKIILQNLVFYASLAVRSGDVDAFVAGAATTTRDVAKAAIYCIGPSKDTPTVSSSTILILPDNRLGSNGAFIYADAGIVPDPTSEQLRDIAVASVKMAQVLFDDEPRVAMLSYSTKGSGGSSPSIQKVQQAAKLIKDRFPDLLIDGEVQIDSAIVSEVSKRKDPFSLIKGRANIFIFPNLDAGNIAYKLTERLAKADAIGPILQGLDKPASDLSRGCNSHDIVNTCAVTSILAQNIVPIKNSR